MTRHRDALIGLALFGAALTIRLIVASWLVFPPLDDPAFYVQTARHLAAGRGLVTDVIWSYQFPFAQVTHPSHEYWMPLATLLMAPFIRLLGDTWFVAQLPGVICGALLAPITYWLGRQAWPAERDRKLAIGAATLLLAGALPVYQSASADSAAPFAAFASLALIAGGLSLERRSVGGCFVAGVLSGLAYLARSDGLLIPVCIAAVMLYQFTPRRPPVALLLGLVAGAALAIGPWWIRNLSAFGLTQPVSPLTAAALLSYGQLFNWNDPPTLASLFERGLAFVVDLRLRAVLHNLSVWIVIAFPFGLYGLPGLIGNHRHVIRLGFIYAIALWLASVLIFSVPTMAGLFYHSAGATLPWLAIGSLAVLRSFWARGWRPVVVGLCLSTIVLIVIQAAAAWPAAIAGSAADRVKFAHAAAWLQSHVPSGQPVIATQAHSLNYASGYPALTLPNQQDIDTLRRLADRYGARFIVVTERVGLYPDALDAARSGGVQKRLEADGVVIYDLRPPE